MCRAVPPRRLSLLLLRIIPTSQSEASNRGRNGWRMEPCHFCYRKGPIFPSVLTTGKLFLFPHTLIGNRIYEIFIDIYIYIYLLFEWNQLMKCLLNSQIWKEIPFYQPSFWVPMSNFQGGPAQKNIQTIRVWWRMPFPIVLSFVLLNMRPGPASFFLLHFSFNDGLLAPKQKSLMWN